MNVSSRMCVSRLCLVAVATLVCNKAWAVEGLTPFAPGITTGIPVGALPPPGFHVGSNSYVVFGKIKDGRGNTLPIKVVNYSETFSLLWSSPYHILGAQYGAGILQAMSSHGVDARDIGGRSTRDFGMFNTILQPVILSWRLKEGLFVSMAHSVYLKNGDVTIRDGVRDQSSYANDFWTYEPSVAVSYLHDGLDLTANLVYDHNGKNRRTGYQSGDVVYLDLTAAKQVGKVTYGLVGNYTRQIEDDELHGQVVGDGNRVSHIMGGPMLAYQAGRFRLMARYLADIRSRNDVGLSVVYLSIGTEF